MVNFREHSMRRKTILSILFVIIAGLPNGCAYFNTFYNAEQYFETAEKARLEKTDENLPTTAKDAYEKVIQKSRIILKKYPDSKYVDSARLLIGISRYHLKEYKTAEEVFRKLLQEGSVSYRFKTRYWLALCKWKQGLPQPALDDLHELVQMDISDDLMSKVYLSISGLYLEQEDSKNALNMLEKAAVLVRSSAEKSQIYYQLSELAEKGEDWERAVDAYQQVIKHSLAKSRIMDAHLQIIRIYRLSEQTERAHKKATKLIKDEDYESIHGDLTLETGKIFQAQGRMDDALKVYTNIPTDYPKTEASAEARYLLGKYALDVLWDLDKAKIEMEEVSKEYRQSPYTSLAQKQTKQIQKALTAMESIRSLTHEVIALDTISQDSVVLDTTNVDSVAIELKTEEVANHRYALAELETFHFDKSTIALNQLDTILLQPKKFSVYPKAVYLKAHILKSSGDVERADSLENVIVEAWPSTDFAEKILTSRGVVKEMTQSEETFNYYESLWETNPETTFVHFKKLILRDSLSTTSASAGYFLSYHYDHTYFELDSALKYYRWLHYFHPESEQAITSKNRFQILQSMFNELNTDSTEFITDSLNVKAEKDSLIIPDSLDSSIVAEDSTQTLLIQDSLKTTALSIIDPLNVTGFNDSLAKSELHDSLNITVTEDTIQSVIDRDSSNVDTVKTIPEYPLSKTQWDE